MQIWKVKIMTFLWNIFDRPLGGTMKLIFVIEFQMKKKIKDKI